MLQTPMFLRSVRLALAISVLSASIWAQDQMPMLESSGLPGGEPEAVLPAGAWAHARLQNVMGTLEAMNDLIMAFVPEKIVPPEMQGILEHPKPLLAFMGMNSFGSPVTPELISALFGLDSARAVTLTFYPMPPDQGFVLSLPMANAQALTGLVMNLMRARHFENSEIAGKKAFLVQGVNPDLPEEVVIVCSEDRAYICGHRRLAGMLFDAPARLEDSTIDRAVKDYGKDELLLALDPAFARPLLDQVSQEYSRIPPGMIQKLREDFLRDVPPGQRQNIDLRLRMQFGINGIDEALDLGECLATASYEVLFAWLAEELKSLDGFALSLDIDGRFQKLRAALYSKSIHASASAQPLPLDLIKNTLARLPGQHSAVMASGQLPAAGPSPLFLAWSKAIRAKLAAKSIQAERLVAILDYCEKTVIDQPLASKVPWLISVPSPGKAAEPIAADATFSDYLAAFSKRVNESGAGSWTTVMPVQAPDFLEKHFAAMAAASAKNETLYQDAMAKAEMGQPWVRSSCRFRKEAAQGQVQTMVLEQVHTTRFGLLGYSEHELVNRKRLHSRQLEDLLFIEEGASAHSGLAQLNALPVAKLAKSVEALFGLAPAKTNMLQLARILQELGWVLAEAANIESILHRDMENYLRRANQLAAGKSIEQALPDLLQLEIPLPVLSLNWSAAQKEFYCVLPAGLRFPRPKVLPLIRDLLKDYLDNADNVGGGAVFSRARDGQLELQIVQSTEALALLVRSAVNRFASRYLLAEDGQQRLMSSVVAPGDGQEWKQESVVINTLWEFLVQREGLLPAEDF